ncbi:vesicle transport through interaction with t-SNAREs homolog 1B [Chironomus tepperi]|uniref:vesicle transport through interaction with t-SNAREs homolog 1B n=1 Tax=Chironomus tepperi TaxID=113505 RepID=UPI00391FBC82
MSAYDWDAHNRRAVAEGRQILERTTASLARSNQVAIETENTGTEILSELDAQREALLRTGQRLENADDGLSSSNKIMRTMLRTAFYNKLILILIIFLEICILAGMIYMKFVK